MRKVHVGLDVKLDPLQLSNLQEELDKVLLARSEPYVVKLYTVLLKDSSRNCP
jgi:hypothetical protein